MARMGAGIAAASLGAPLAGVLTLSKERQEPKGPLSWDEIRNLFDLDRSYIHMAGLLLASHPKPVREAIEKHRRALDDNPVHVWEKMSGPYEDEVRKAAASYLRTKPQNIALTDSTTMGLATLYNGIVARPDQEMLSTVHDHYSTITSLDLRSQKTGVPVRRITLFEHSGTATVDEIVGRLKSEIKPNTRVVAVTWVHSSTGMRLPIPQMAAAIAKANVGRSEADRILFCVDGVHGFGAEDLEIEAMGCDFLVAGCHKWLFGPRGTVILWGKPESQKFLLPTIPSFSDRATFGHYLTPGGFHSFEHRWALASAFALHERIGKARVRERIHTFARHCKEELSKMPGVTVYTPMSDDLSAGLVCFNLEKLPQHEVVARLEQKRIIASQTPYFISYARLTPSLLNSPEEVDKTLGAIRELV